MDSLRSYNGLESKDVRGTQRHVHMRLGVDILRFYNGLGSMDVRGIHGRVQMQLRVDILRFYNGLGSMDVRGTKGWLKPNGPKCSKIEGLGPFALHLTVDTNHDDCVIRHNERQCA